MEVLVLTFHDVAADADASGFRGPEAAHYKLTPERFEVHLDAIAAAGAAPERVPSDSRASGRSLVLTFDDGGGSAASVVAPALAERGWRAHFFVVSGLLGAPGFLTRDGVRALHRVGHAVGSHGVTHRPLSLLSRADAERELKESKAALEELIGAPVDEVAVPGGFYSAALDELAAAAGYRRVFTSEPWLRPRVRGGVEIFGRFAVYRGTSVDEVVRLCRRSRRAVWKRRAGWRAKQGARSALGPLYAAARRAALTRRWGG